MRVLREGLAALLLLLVLAVPALGGKPNTIAVTDGVFATDDTAVISFTTNVDRPWARADCFQDGELVYAQFVALYPDHGQYDDAFTLGPTPLWQGGDAECTAKLLEYRSTTGTFRERASTTFSVSG